MYAWLPPIIGAVVGISAAGGLIGWLATGDSRLLLLAIPLLLIFKT